MTKKTYIIELLKKLEPYWSLVNNLIQIIENESCSEEDINTIIEIIEKHIQEVDNEDIKRKFLKVHELLVQIRQQEAEDRQKEEGEINELLIQINQL